MSGTQVKRKGRGIASGQIFCAAILASVIANSKGKCQGAFMKPQDEYTEATILSINPPDDPTFAATVQPRNQRKIERNQRKIQQFTGNWGENERKLAQNSSEFPRDSCQLADFPLISRLHCGSKSWVSRVGFHTILFLAGDDHVQPRIMTRDKAASVPGLVHNMFPLQEKVKF